VPAEATVPANTANWCCTVFNGSLLFDSRHAYELLLTKIAAMFLLGCRNQEEDRSQEDNVKGEKINYHKQVLRLNKCKCC
jgi:hypothetical protein